MKNVRRIARKPTLVGLGALGNDPDHHDVFPGGRPGIPATRHAWTHADCPFRVHFYDPLQRGTWHHYFPEYQAARDFAIGRCLHGRPCEVEQRPTA